MIKIDCSGCNICCGVECFNPVLLPSEEKKFKKYSLKIKTPFRDIFILKRKKDGYCLFQNKTNSGCRIYGKRPADCRLFPYSLRFNKKGEVKIMLDREICKRADKGKYDKLKLEKNIKNLKIPTDYGKAYYYYIHND